MSNRLNVWSTRDNPNQTFTVAMQLAIRSAPDTALYRLATGNELLTGFTPDDAQTMLKNRGFVFSGGVGKLPCDDCGVHVRKRQKWFSRFVCKRCLKLIKDRWSQQRLGKAGRKAKEAVA